MASNYRAGSWVIAPGQAFLNGWTGSVYLRREGSRVFINIRSLAVGTAKADGTPVINLASINPSLAPDPTIDTTADDFSMWTACVVVPSAAVSCGVVAVGAGNLLCYGMSTLTTQLMYGSGYYWANLA